LAACHHSFHEGFCEASGFVEDDAGDDDEALEGSDSSIGIKGRRWLSAKLNLVPTAFRISKLTMDEDEVPYVWSLLNTTRMNDLLMQ
jgi:hypothetical protein